MSLTGTKAHAVLTEGRQKTAKVIDLSYGGVALEFEETEDLPSQFNAVLHVPILPPVRVVLRKAYALRAANGLGSHRLLLRRVTVSARYTWLAS